MPNYSCGHQPWMGIKCTECAPDAFKGVATSFQGTVPCPTCAQWEKEANEERVRWSNASLEWNELVTKLENRLILTERVAKAADRVTTEVFGYEPYDKAMGDLIDALNDLEKAG